MYFNAFNRLKYLFFKVENDWEIGFKKVEINDLKNINLNNIKWLKMPKKSILC